MVDIRRSSAFPSHLTSLASHMLCPCDPLQASTGHAVAVKDAGHPIPPTLVIGAASLS